LSNKFHRVLPDRHAAADIATRDGWESSTSTSTTTNDDEYDDE